MEPSVKSPKLMYIPPHLLKKTVHAAHPQLVTSNHTSYRCSFSLDASFNSPNAVLLVLTDALPLRIPPRLKRR